MNCIHHELSSCLLMCCSWDSTYCVLPVFTPCTHPVTVLYTHRTGWCLMCVTCQRLLISRLLPGGELQGGWLWTQAPLSLFCLRGHKMGNRVGNKRLLKWWTVCVCIWTLMHTSLCSVWFLFFLSAVRSLWGGASLHSFCCHVRLCLHTCVICLPAAQGPCNSMSAT